jgi:hypothetical protein
VVARSLRGGYQPVLFNDYDEEDEEMMQQLPAPVGLALFTLFCSPNTFN